MGWEGYEEVEEEEAQILGTAAARGVTEASVCVRWGLLHDSGSGSTKQV